MRRYKCPIRDAEAVFYRLPFVILTKMKHHNCGRRAVLEGDVQLCRQELDSDVVKSLLLDGYKMHV